MNPLASPLRVDPRDECLAVPAAKIVRHRHRSADEARGTAMAEIGVLARVEAREPRGPDMFVSVAVLGDDVAGDGERCVQHYGWPVST